MRDDHMEQLAKPRHRMRDGALPTRARACVRCGPSRPRPGAPERKAIFGGDLLRSAPTVEELAPSVPRRAHGLSST